MAICTRRRTITLAACLLTTLLLAHTLTGCAGRREPGYADKDGTTTVTREKEEPRNYGSGNSDLDKQADENKVDLLRHKMSF